MKKLITVLSALAMSVVARAAALDWATWGYINEGDVESDWISGGQAYLVMVTDKDNFSVADDLTVTGGSIVQSNAFDGGMTGGAWNDTSSLLDGNTYYFAIIGTSDGTGIDVPTTGTYGIDDNGGALYSVVWNASTGGAFAPDEEFGGFGMATPVGGTPIPEPTSGLLMVLGMAGLALRRRRA